MRWCVVKCSAIFTGKAIRHFRGRISDHIGTIFISQVKKYKWVAIRQSDSKTLLSLPLLLITVWKVSKYGLISCPYFPVFGLNTERYEVSLRIQSECGKIRTRNNSVFGHLKYLSVFSPNAGKYEPEINPYSEAFHAVWKYIFNCSKLDYSMYPQRMKISFKYIKQIRRSIEWFTNTAWDISFQIRSLLCSVFFRKNFIFAHFSNSI